MVTKLTDTSPLRREITLLGHPVVVTLKENGLELRVKHTQLPITVDWITIAAISSTPKGCHPLYVRGRPLEFMKSQMEMQKRRKAVL